MLMNAGNVLVVTGVERSPLSSSLRNIVMKRFELTESGEQMINIAGQLVTCHADFHLILISSVPLHVRGTYTSSLHFVLCTNTNSISYYGMKA